jgi:hypothetical protein
VARVSIPGRDNGFFFTAMSIPALGLPTASYAGGIQDFALWVRRSERKSSSVDVKKGGAISLLPIRLHGVVLN